MNAAQAAALFNGREYREEMTRAESLALREAGLVAVYGASDDLVEFCGAIDDEVGAWDGITVFVDERGLLPDRESIDNDVELADYFARKPKARAIDALWCDDDEHSWTYVTDIPHATFEIVEDGEPYCRGIVFALADAAQGTEAQRAETVEQGSVHDGPVGKADAPNPSLSSQGS